MNIIIIFKLDAPRKSMDSELFNVLNLASQAMHDVVHDFLSSQISHSLELDKFPIETRCDGSDR